MPIPSSTKSMPRSQTSLEYNVEGMDCYDCARTIERAVTALPGVTEASVSFPSGKMLVGLDPAEAQPDGIPQLLRRLGYRSTPSSEESVEDPDQGRFDRETLSTATSSVFLLIALLVDWTTDLRALTLALYGTAIVIGGWPIARAGVAALVATRRLDMRFLMTIAVIGAVAIEAWTEAALVVVLFSIGEMLEGRAVDRARRELAGLVSLAPDTARVRRSANEIHEIQASELVLGDVIEIRPGERVAADGVVVDGESTVDQAPITGESTPIDKTAGDSVFAGTLNVYGLLAVRVDVEPGDSTLKRIARLVEEAQAQKAPSERWVDNFARYYTPAVIAIALVTAIVPPLAFGTEFADSLYTALALLILACPCALVISTPVSIVSSLARASSAGVLVKGGAHLEQAATVEVVAFDKTGTLTEGSPCVVRVAGLASPEEHVLATAASLEQGSEHPLAKAILENAAERELVLAPVSEFKAFVGLGAEGVVDSSRVRIGNARLFADDVAVTDSAAPVLAEFAREGITAVILADDSGALGVIGLADKIRPEASDALAALAKLGIERTVMLTGDNRAVAEATAKAIGLSEVKPDLLPGDKSAAVEALGARSVMVGDGVNDAPALASADLGIAMGSAGSPTAIEVADVALMGDDPRKVAGLIGSARWTKAVVRQNIAFSLGTKLAAAAILAVGALPLWGAVATDVGASLVVVANGLRLLRGTPIGKLRDAPMLAAAPRSAKTDSDA